MMNIYRYVLILAIVLINSRLCAAASGYLDVQIIQPDMTYGPAESATNKISFNNSANVTGASPWIVADQYLRVEFDGIKDHYWAIRIITDNYNDIVYSNIPFVVRGIEPIDFGVVHPEPYYDDSNPPNKYYGGMINVELDESENITWITDNSYYRIMLAWQVYNENDTVILEVPNTNPPIYLPAERYYGIAPPQAADRNLDGIYEDKDIAVDWLDSYLDGDDPGSYSDGNWAYLGDRSDDTYKTQLDDLLPGNQIAYDTRVDNDGDGKSDWWYNYDMIVYGNGLSDISYAPHPGTEGTMLNDDNGDGHYDLYVYLAGRFYNTSYLDEDGDGVYDDKNVYHAVPAGEYRGSMYLEMFYE